METRKITIEQAKQMDLVDYLASLGHYPDQKKTRNQDYWYLSPLRTEKTPSFKVNRKLNVWYDHGLAQSGTIIDFGILFHRCTIPELLEKLQASFSFHPPLVPFAGQQEGAGERKIKFLSDRENVEIEKPCLSTVLSGTPKQVASLIPNAENGLFSRFMFYFMNVKPIWKDVFSFSSDNGLEDYYNSLGEIFFRLYQSLEANPDIQFCLTTDQQHQFNAFFEQVQETYITLKGLV